MKSALNAACGTLIAMSVAALTCGCSTPAPVPPATPAPEPKGRILASDFDLITGAPWKGTLTRHYHQTSETTTTPSTMEIRRLPPSPEMPESWELRISLDGEPNADESGVIDISAGGTKVRGQNVLERVRAQQSFSVVTQTAGEHNGTVVRVNYVYSFSARECAIQKFVRSEPWGNSLELHTYSWTR